MTDNLTALADAQRFLAAHPDVARIAYLTVHRGVWNLQLPRSEGDDGTRIGIIYALAATYSGDVVRDQLWGDDHISTDFTWAEGKSLRVWTPVAKIAQASA